MMLRDEIRGRILSRRESCTVDDAPEFSVVVDQRVLHRRQLLIETNLVFLKVLAPDEAALVVRLFGISFGVVTSYLSPLDAVTADLLQGGPRAVNKNRRLDDLLGRELHVRRLRLNRLRGFLWSCGLGWSGIVLRQRVLRRCRHPTCAGYCNQYCERGESYEGKKCAKQK